MIQQSEEPKDASMLSAMSEGKESTNKVKAICRFRPFNEAEFRKQRGIPKSSFDIIDKAVYRRREQDINIFSNGETKSGVGNMDGKLLGEPYLFDDIIDENASQQDVYNICAASIVQDILNGLSSGCCILTYGQTSSGKTYTLLGDYKHGISPASGILPRVIDHIFHSVSRNIMKQHIRVKRSAVEIYCGNIFDLSQPLKNRVKLSTKEGVLNGVGKPNSRYANSAQELLQDFSQLISNRCVSQTQSNRQSSRSHAIFIISVEKTLGNSAQTSTFYLVDLAGSEKVSGDKKAKQEGNFINKSLSALGTNLQQLASNVQPTYRMNLLTQALKPCFENNCKTTILINVSHADNDGESTKSMRFGQNARLVKTSHRPTFQKDSEQDTMDEVFEELVNLAGIEIYRLIVLMQQYKNLYRKEIAQRKRLERQYEELEGKYKRLKGKCKVQVEEDHFGDLFR